MHEFEEDFACRCGDERRGECVDRLDWAMRELGVTDSSMFVSHAVMELMLRYDIDIVGIPASQWFGIDYRPSLTEPENKDSQGRVQCDWVEDGFALLLRSCHERWGAHRPGSDRATAAEQGDDGMRLSTTR